MKCVIINGSYHKEGSIVNLINGFIKGLKENNAGANVEVIDLIDRNFNFCRGCSGCGTNDGKELGICVQNDGLSEILSKMASSDILVFANPIYEFNVTAIMKKFIERLMPVLYNDGKKGFPQARIKLKENKKGFVLLSSGCPYPINALAGINKYAKYILGMFCKAFGCSKRKVLQAGGMGGSGKANNLFIKKAYQLGLSAAGA